MKSLATVLRFGARWWLAAVLLFIGLGRVGLNTDPRPGSLDPRLFYFHARAVEFISFSIGGTLENLIAAALVLWLAAAAAGRRRPRIERSFALPALVLGATVLLSAVFSPFPFRVSGDGLTAYLAGIAVFFLAASLGSDEGTRRRLWTFLIAGILISAAGGVVMYLRGVYFPLAARRIWLPFLHPNTSGAALLLVIPVCLSLSVSNWPRPAGVFYAAAAAGLGCALFLTFSRTAWIGIFFALALLARRWKRGRILIALALGASLLLAVGIRVGPQSYLRERVEGIFGFRIDPNIHKRMIYWEASGRMIAERPWLGYGPGRRIYPDIYEGRFKEQETGESPSHSHSLYLSQAVGSGLLSLAALGWFIWALTRSLSAQGRFPRRSFAGGFARGLAASFFAFFFTAFIDDHFYTSRLMILFFAAAGLAAAGGSRSAVERKEAGAQEDSGRNRAGRS